TEGYDASTCWNGADGIYQCPAGSHTYFYDLDGQSYKLYATGEYNNGLNWINTLPVYSSLLGCFSAVEKGDSTECGDGIVGEDEDCEAGDIGVESCNSGEGFRQLTCQSNCTWDHSGVCQAGQCGDGIMQTGENCDDGQFNGRYGFCDTNCNALSAYCGDGTLNAPFEDCDSGSANGDYDSECSWDCKEPGPSCGDGLVNGPEDCDGNNESTTDGCQTGYQKTKVCTENCVWDNPSPGCTIIGSCGDGVKNTSEQCDDGNGVDTDGCTNECKIAICGDKIVRTFKEMCDKGPGNDCIAEYGFTCNYCSNACTITTKTGGFCGDEIKNGPEQCDTSDLGGKNCIDFGLFELTGLHAGTSLMCTSDCSFDVSKCAGSICGDGRIDGNEVCDSGGIDGASAYFDGKTCETEGFNFGNLSCENDCMEINIDNCTQCTQSYCDSQPVSSCHHVVCESTGCVTHTDTNGTPCGSSGSGYTCDNGICQAPLPTCGDGIKNGDEECDGSDLGNQSCSDFGLVDGTLACNPNTCMVNTSYCFAPTYRVNAGGSEYINEGIVWEADNYYTGGSAWGPIGREIFSTNDDLLYQSERWGTFTYNFDVKKSGQYVIILHFAEIYDFVVQGYTARKFNVDIEGQRKLTEFDIINQAGAGYTAMTKRFTQTVQDTTLTIEFLQGSSNNPKISAIEVIPEGQAPPPPPPECTASSDCSQSADECKRAVCQASSCVEQNELDGRPCTGGTCQNGSCEPTITCNTNQCIADTKADTTNYGECWTGSCYENLCQEEKEPDGKSCSTNFYSICDNGSCVCDQTLCSGKSHTDCTIPQCVGTSCNVVADPSKNGTSCNSGAGICNNGVCEETCGNGVIDTGEGEVCDLSAPDPYGGVTCQSLFPGESDGGTLACINCHTIGDNRCTFPDPQIATIGPTSGVAGNTLYIAGLNFGDEQCIKPGYCGYVLFGPVEATEYSWWVDSGIAISLKVPSYWNTGPVKLRLMRWNPNGSNSWSNQVEFTYE
ncbi:malectin domain-containing carbohydrate-binding protein, partial [Patescibacteria group bacterium]